MADNEQIYQVLLEQNKTLGRIEATVTHATVTLSAHETRIATVEASQSRIKWLAVGAGAAITAVWRVAEAFLTGGHH